MNRPRILVVDDDERICFVAMRALEAIGLCDSAHDVSEAVRALNRQTYDLVLLDVTLPGPSGMTLLDQLRDHWPQTAAVMISGLTDLSVAREALSRGAVGYVVKPFRVQDLRIQATAALSDARQSANALRASTRARIEVTLARQIGEGAPIACVVVDLEHVPLLSATYGADAINELCECVQRRLDDFDESVCVLGQLDSATFAASLTVPSGGTASQLARAIFRTLSAPVVVGGQRIPIAARLGLAVASPGDTAASIVSLAEAAAGAARDGGLPFVVYDGDLRVTAQAQLELLADAAAAIHRRHLHVAYQPQHDLVTGECVGIEALARWHHPTRGDIPPSVFVPIAERMDLIAELGRSVLETACRDVAWLRRLRGPPDLHVSANVSAAELGDVDYPGRLATALEGANLPPAALRLEITESLALDESTEVQRVLGGIQRLGVRLSADDFGTGYCSFSSLTRIPWAELKLDRSLTTQCRDPRGREMLRAIVAFGAALDIDVIAEGIETPDQLDALRGLGCRQGQGFLLGRPQAISSLAHHLESGVARGIVGERRKRRATLSGVV